MILTLSFVVVVVVVVEVWCELRDAWMQCNYFCRRDAGEYKKMPGRKAVFISEEDLRIIISSFCVDALRCMYKFVVKR